MPDDPTDRRVEADADDPDTPAGVAPELGEALADDEVVTQPGPDAGPAADRGEPSDADVGPVSDDALIAAAESVGIDLKALLDERTALMGERDEFLEAYRRAQADFENFRKLAQRRQQEEVQRTLGSFVERLLPVLDACDAAMAHGAEGAREVFDALLAALEKEGLTRVDPVGEPFDPNVAEAVMHEPGEGGEQVVTEVLRVGYLWNERVLRPAMVKVTG